MAEQYKRTRVYLETDQGEKEVVLLESDEMIVKSLHNSCLTASDIHIKIPKYISPKTVRDSLRRLRKKVLVDKISPNDEAATPNQLWPTYELTPFGERVLKHLTQKTAVKA